MILNIGNAKQGVIVIRGKKAWGTLYDINHNRTIANFCMNFLGDVLNECSSEPESKDVNPDPPLSTTSRFIRHVTAVPHGKE
jgi:hypothetical protein